MIELHQGVTEQLADFRTGYYAKKKRSVWAAVAGWDKLVLVLMLISLSLALIALFILVTPVLDIILEFMGLHYSAWSAWKNWVMVGDRGVFIAAAFGLAALLFALLARFRIRRSWSFFAEAGCPQCHEPELIRVRRNRRDRALSFIGMPVRRYSCRNCTWHGVRLVGYRHVRGFSDNEEFVAENLEIEDGLIGTAVETDGAIATGETIMVLEPAVEVIATDMSLEDVPEVESKMLEEQPVEPFSAAAVVNGTNVEELTVKVLESETDEDKDWENEPANEAKEEVEVDMLAGYGVENGDVQPALPGEIDAAIEEKSLIIDEDGEFARLCFEVALSKK